MSDPADGTAQAEPVREAVGKVFDKPPESPDGKDTAEAKENRDGGRDRSANQPGDEERGLLQNEIRAALADGLSALGGFGSGTSAVTIVPGGTSTFTGPIAGRDV